MDVGYALVFMTGLLGGFGHCIGMCGPLVASSALHVSSSQPAGVAGRVVPQLLYHAGRVTTYGLVGAVMGLAGSFVNVAGRLAGVQNAVMILAGVIMVAMGLGIVGLMRGAAWLERHNSFLFIRAKIILGSASPYRYFPLGLLLGLLPCGLSYTAFIAAAGTGTPSAGLITMLAFGAGTVPALALFGVVVTYLGSRLRGRIQKAGGAAVIVMGLYFLAKGIRYYAQV